MKVEKTYLEVIVLNKIAVNYLNKNVDETGKPIENKMTESVRKFNAKQLVKQIDEYNDKLDDIQLSVCAVDEKTKVILKDQGQRQYTVDGQRKLKEQNKALLNTKIELHARIVEDAADLIELMTDEEKEAFSGLLIPEIKTEETEA